MSGVFFDELDIPTPSVNLEVGSDTHGRQTAKIISRFEAYLSEVERPDWVVVFGDTNSTLAATLTASKLAIPIAHVESGLRSGDGSMPEEINRIVTDKLSNLRFCPSETAVRNLGAEGIREGVHNTGDIMFDSILRYGRKIEDVSRELEGDLFDGHWAVATVHRQENVDDPVRLAALIDCVESAGMPVLWPVHPRASAAIERFGLTLPATVTVVKPMSYLRMLAHVVAADLVITDSGGLQKEAFWLGTPCITLRNTTEWPETLAGGRNVLVGHDPSSVRRALSRPLSKAQSNPYGDGAAALRMAQLLILR
jgi:UDP-N-acetylglucosamine 2-epimerase